MEDRKIVINPHNNLLSFEEYFYALQDVEEPNTYRNIFPLYGDTQNCVQPTRCANEYAGGNMDYRYGSGQSSSRERPIRQSRL